MGRAMNDIVPDTPKARPKFRPLKTSALAATGVFFLLFGAIVLRLAWPISTPPFRDANGQVLAHSIATIERWPIGGIAQSVIIRGRDSANPVLVWVHGGPGSSETPVVRHFNAALENGFVVVYWDQRYAGRSLDLFGPPPKNPKIEDYVSDLGSLVTQLRAQLHRRKVVIVAHSWGTVPGLLYAERHPENVAAYVGIGQEADTPESEKRSYAFLLSEARREGNADDVARLVKLGPPRPGSPWTPRDLLQKYGAAFHADLDVVKLALISADASEVNGRDLAALVFAKPYNTAIEKQEAGVVFDKDHLHFAVPMFFFAGRYDHTVDALLAARYLSRLSAPQKKFVWFENSAHSPPFEEPQKFDAVLLNEVRPLALAH
jgi:pimeloyl-ACP methyl ester carboxylesterase